MWRYKSSEGGCGYARLVCGLGPLRVADMPAHSSNNNSTTTEVILRHVKEITAMLVVNSRSVLVPRGGTTGYEGQDRTRDWNAINE